MTAISVALKTHEYPCPKCGQSDPYICADGRTNGAVQLSCRNPGCRANFTTLTGTVWAATKLRPEVRARIEELWRSGVHPAGIARLTGLTYKTAWMAARRLGADHAG